MTNRIIVLSLIIYATAGLAHAAEPEVTLTSKCREIVRHVPDADVTYRPGVDNAGGKPVVPADLDAPAPIGVPQNFDIEIDAPLAGGDGGTGAAAAPGFQPSAKIGKVQVKDLEGAASLDFEGQPLYRTGPGTASPECAE